jgi:hypothetical protein
MEYSIGDKVRIRKDLRGGEEYKGIYCTFAMEDLAGEEVTIVHKFTHSTKNPFLYNIREDIADHSWCLDMFEDKGMEIINGK